MRGPMTFLKHMFTWDRLPFTATYGCSVIATLYAVLVVGNHCCAREVQSTDFKMYAAPKLYLDRCVLLDTAGRSRLVLYIVSAGRRQQHALDGPRAHAESQLRIVATRLTIVQNRECTIYHHVISSLLLRKMLEAVFAALEGTETTLFHVECKQNASTSFASH